MRLSSLPRFQSLLVHGPYLPAAPIHLSLSVPPPHRAVLFSPSRDALLHALQSHTDEWLNTRSGTGSAAAMSSRVTVFYPPSPQHLVAVLAMLRIHDMSSPSVPVVPKVTLDRAPTLLVLHEPSAYFLSEREDPRHTVSSYLLLITHALSAIEYLSSQSLTYVVILVPGDYANRPSSSPASLVVFDTRLGQLKLPVLRTPPRSALGDRDDSEDVPKPESVLFFVEKYFELSGTFQRQAEFVPQLPDSAPLPAHGHTDSDPLTSVLALHRIGGGEVEGIDCSIVD